ncbi:hypothetical protein AAY473_016825 [Plecturocebus cupreus]
MQAPDLGSFHVVLSLWVHRSQELGFGNLYLDFRGDMEIPQCPGRSLLQWWGAHGEPLLGLLQQIRLVDLNNRHLLFVILDSGKQKIKMLADPLSGCPDECPALSREGSASLQAGSPIMSSDLAESMAFYGPQRRGKSVMIGPWVATVGPEKAKQVPTPVYGTISPAPRLQALPGLTVELRPAPDLFQPGACLLPASIHRTQDVPGKGNLQASTELSSALPSASLPCLSIPQAWRRAKQREAGMLALPGSCAHLAWLQQHLAWPQICSKIRLGARSGERPGSRSRYLQVCRGFGGLPVPRVQRCLGLQLRLSG